MQTDFITADPESGQLIAQGSMAERLLASGMNPAALRVNASLRKDEWELLDTTVVQVGRDRLNGVADLMERGLTLPVTNPLGTLVVQHETQTEMTAAQVSMDGVTRNQGDRVTWDLVNTPLPIIHHDFELSIRHLSASRSLGNPLDTTMVEEATIQVTERMEDLLFNGLSSGNILGFGSSTASLFGYTTRTNRNTYSVPLAWDQSAITGEDILTDVLAMIDIAHGDKHFGPFGLYVPQTWWVPLFEDFKANSDKTIFQRLMEIPDLQFIKPADKLTADNAVLTELTRRNADIIDGMQPTVVSWETKGGMQLNFKVMAIMAPRIKLDANNSSGVVHAS